MLVVVIYVMATKVAGSSKTLFRKILRRNLSLR